MTYRDDLQAARMRREVLARELHEVRSRMDEFDGLARQAGALERELAQTARDLDQVRARVELPLLQQVRVASPCKERWDDMTGDERVRFCGRCEKNVYDLSALTAAQAEALLRERGESMCLRFFRRSDGTILTSDCPVGGRKRFWRRAATAAVASGLAAVSITVAATGAPVMGQAMTVEQETYGSELGGMTVGMHLDRLQSRLEHDGQRINEEIAAAQIRLAEATTVAEKEAGLAHLNRLLDQARQTRKELREARQDERKVEACRKSPLDC